MPFPFLYICDLLEKLQEILIRDPPLLPKDLERTWREAIERWFVNHRPRIDNEADGLVLLSTLLPEKRPERVYMLQANRLEKLVGRVLALPNSRRVDLERWRQPGAGDLGDCVERVQTHGEMVMTARAKDVSIEDIDSVLSSIACRNRFSSPSVRAIRKKDAGKGKDPTGELGIIFSRLRARESKWLTRLILKTYSPISLPEGTVYRQYHFLLPSILKVQSELQAALRLLASLGVRSSSFIPNNGHHLDVLKSLRPLVGVKVGRPPFFQGRGIKHCVDMAQNRRMSIEKKYDGEYFQLHIDMSKARRNRIKIFSKNGRDSTEDRVAIHGTVRQCLGLDDPNCKISTMCILEGELLVYSDKENRILDFHQVRKHVSRSGSFLGVGLDSQPNHYEHLMLVFFDILALNGEQVLGLKQHDRRRLLESVIHKIPGRADLTEYRIICFSSPSAATKLRTVFAKCITARGEGLVMKPVDEPYFNFENSRNFRSCCIKMKKEAIGTFGEVGDFAIIGAAYDPVKVKNYRISSLQWTDFYVGCLENKDAVLETGAKPRFVVVTTVSLNEMNLEALVHTPHLVSSPYGNTDHFDLRIESGINHGRKPSVIFTSPPVVDIHCFAFDKEGNTGFWTMRFPAVTKLHNDRTYLDTISFFELQRMAETHKAIPEDEAEEERRWIKLLEAADPRGIAVDASTQRTSSSAPTTPSPRRRKMEESGQYRPFLIREDTTERQHQVLDGDELTTSTPYIPVDQVSSLTNFAKPPAGTEHQMGTLVSLSSTAIEKLNQSSKRTRHANSDSPDQPLKRQKISGSSNRPCLHTIVIDNPQMGKSALFRPLLDIRNSPIQLHKSPILSTSLPVARRVTSEVQVSHARELTKVNCSLPAESPYPTPPDIDDSSPRPGNDNILEASICQRAPASCSFAHCSLSLAPCVAEMAQLKEDLLAGHRVRFILDPALWLNSHKHPTSCSPPKPKIRKLVLVDPGNAPETIRTFQAIQNLKLVKADGKREWVEVYDYRIVECASKIEAGIKFNYDIWRHFWIGAA